MVRKAQNPKVFALDPLCILFELLQKIVRIRKQHGAPAVSRQVIVSEDAGQDGFLSFSSRFPNSSLLLPLEYPTSYADVCQYMLSSCHRSALEKLSAAPAFCHS